MEHAKLPLEMPETKKDEGPVTCLGMTFENDQERREYFTEILRQKLPELKKIEGYPIGEDEDILALSDPPYYTACPNPFINDFIKEWEQEKEKHYGSGDEEYHREPFAADVTEGKNDPIYNAHSYLTKTPHRAIMRYILHYTSPGDIVLDSFSGSGMTGVASNLCADKASVEDLGYQVRSDGTIFGKDDLTDEQGIISRIGKRHAILCDLSTSASFLSHSYNTPVAQKNFERDVGATLKRLRSEFGFLYKTLKQEDSMLGVEIAGAINKAKNLDRVKDILQEYESHLGDINYVAWSDVYVCPHCSVDLIFWEVALDAKKRVKKYSLCNSCGAEISMRGLERALRFFNDNCLQQVSKTVKRVPFLINYSVGKTRCSKAPDELDLAIINFLDDQPIPYSHPKARMIPGGETRRNDSIGATHVHHYYSNRNLLILSAFNEISHVKGNHLRFLHGSVLPKLTRLNRYMPQHGSRALVGPMANTLYMPPMHVENNPLEQIDFQYKKIKKIIGSLNRSVVTTQSATSLPIPDNTIDYVFLDPPFGSNIMYSELNFIRESWLGVITNNESEAVENRVLNKSLEVYKSLMVRCFSEVFRVLKPNRWLTVQFSNTRASVWNAIQSALQETGFIIASLDSLDKKRGGLHAMIGSTAVKQDLVISAYKPPTSMIEEIRIKENTAESAWIFVRSHLEKLPVFVGRKGEAELIVERTPRVLFDRMVAYHVQNGYSVPISSAEFQEGVAQRFPMRDGMAFLETQVIEYDKKRLLAKEFVQTTLFVSDENSAIEWLRQQLMQKPQTRQDLHPNFMKELQHISKHELLPELDVLLEQNFLMYDGTGPVPSQIHAYLSTDFKDLRNLEKEDPKLQAKAKNRWYVPDPNKQADLEKLRERSLLREFNGYIEELGKSKKKLRQFRTEAIRAGFKTAWGNQDYQTIVDVGQRLPEKVLQEDSTMLMYYDNAQVRLGM